MVTNLFQQLQFNWHAIPVALVSTVIFAIGLFVFLQNRKSVVNISFFLICLCVNLWLYGICLVYASQDPVPALAIYKAVTFLGVVYVAPGVYCFSVLWLKLYERQKWFMRATLIGAGTFYLAGLLSPLSFSGVYRYYWGFYPRYGPLNYVFLGFFFTVFLAAFLNFVKAYLKDTDVPQGVN